MNISKFYVCIYYFDHYVYLWNKRKYFDSENDCCRFPPDYLFCCFGNEIVQVCNECLYQKLSSAVLDLESVSKVLNEDCFIYRTS